MISSAPLMSIAVRVGPAVSCGAGVPGRRFVPILGGDVSGMLTGNVLAGGADWQTVAPDGAIEIAAHYLLDIEFHGLVEVRSEGVRHGPPEILAALGRNEQVDPALYYFRAAMRFSTSAAGLLKMNRTLYLARGRRDRGQVHLDVFEVS